MDSLSGIVSFVKTAETLSFVDAARALGLSASAVGKNVAKLEQELGVRLFQRSTRKVHLTTEGEMFYQRCRRILDDLQDAEAMLSHTQEAPRGKLRISVPTIGYRFLLPVLPEFRRLYPEIELAMGKSGKHCYRNRQCDTFTGNPGGIKNTRGHTCPLFWHNANRQTVH